MAKYPWCSILEDLQTIKKDIQSFETVQILDALAEQYESEAQRPDIDSKYNLEVANRLRSLARHVAHNEGWHDYFIEKREEQKLLQDSEFSAIMAL